MKSINKKIREKMDKNWQFPGEKNQILDEIEFKICRKEIK